MYDQKTPFGTNYTGFINRDPSKNPVGISSLRDSSFQVRFQNFCVVYQWAWVFRCQIKT